MKQLLCLGDSITDAGRLFSPNPLGEGYVSMVQATLTDTWEVHNRGTDGFTVQKVLTQMQRELPRYRPDAITLLVGINDVGLIKNTDRTPPQQFQMANTFEKNYEALLSMLTKQCQQILLLEPFIFPWPLEYASWFPQVRDFSERIQRLAQTFGLTFVPLWDALLSRAREIGMEAITTDGVHLEQEGHRLLAAAVLPYL